MKERTMRNNRVMICKLLFSIVSLSIGFLQGAKADEPPTKPILRLELDSHVAPIQDFDLDPQNNVEGNHFNLTLVAKNKIRTIFPTSLLLYSKGKTQKEVVKPKLYVLAIGVSKYNEPSIKSDFSAKDAIDFANEFNVQKGKFYREVVTNILTDEKATRVNIFDGLKWIQKHATNQDVAMIFLAGFGIPDISKDYYYAPNDFELKHIRATGVNFSEIQKTVSSLPGKVLLFVDASNSQYFSSQTKRHKNKVNKTANGLTVFSASTRNELPLENQEWQHGAFTKALLEGLSGKADTKKTGRITVNMLDIYISHRVKELTGEAQHPTTTKPPSTPDFTIVASP